MPAAPADACPGRRAAPKTMLPFISSTPVMDSSVLQVVEAIPAVATKGKLFAEALESFDEEADLGDEESEHMRLEQVLAASRAFQVLGAGVEKVQGALDAAPAINAAATGARCCAASVIEAAAGLGRPQGGSRRRDLVQGPGRPPVREEGHLDEVQGHCHVGAWKVGHQRHA